jgi:anti-sigma factor RsiW
VTHDEVALAAYVSGELNADETERVERHLVDCDQCWASIHEDALGRAAAESLRELAPVGLRDRIRFAMEGEKGPAPRKARRLYSRVAVVLVVLLTAGAVSAGVSQVVGHRAPSDPPAVAAVVRLAEAGAHLGTAPAGPVAIHGGHIWVSRINDGGIPVLVARSDQPFPAPAGATPMVTWASPWIASRGPLSLVCVNRPHPVLLAARMPADRLASIATQLAG